MSELPEDLAPADVPEPRDSALGIVVRRDERGGVELLFGLRSRKARFMPGHSAFPGGRLEKADGAPSPEALRRCASREIREECGFRVPPAAWLDAGERTTPPFFQVRFRTRFFVADFPAGASLPDEPPRPDELERLDFAAPTRALEEWNAGRWLLPPPLIPILRALAGRPEGDAPSIAATATEVNAREDPLPRIEFVPGIWVLPVRTATLPPATHTNVWMPGARRFVAVDPGSQDPREQEALRAVIARRGSEEGASFFAVLLTHHHRDHVRGAAALAGAFGVPILAHGETLRRVAPLLDGIERVPLADGEWIDLGGATLETIHTPGHAPGHVAFRHLERDVLIAGDLVSGLSTILIPPGDGDMAQYLASLRRARDLGCSQVLPSHGPPLPSRALEGALRHRQDREGRVAAALAGRGAAPLAEIAVRAYADTPEAPPFLREMQTRAHLRHLETLGLARVVDGDSETWSAVPRSAP